MTKWLSKTVRRAGRFIPLVLLVLAGACESTSAPERRPSLDARAAMQDYQALESIFASQAWAGVAALGGRTPLSDGAAIAAVQALPDLARGTGDRRFVVDLFAARNRGASGATAFEAAAIEILSDTIRGRTFVYNAASDQYVVAPSRTGAPVNGVRFVLYEVDDRDRPNPAREIGYADLLDEGSAASDAVTLRLIAVKAGATVLNYRTRVVGTDAGGQLSVDGFVVDGVNTLTFVIDATADHSGGQTTVDVSFSLNLDPRDFSVIGEVRGVEGGADGEGTVDIRAEHRDQTLRVLMDNDGGTVDGEITLNGNTFVRISGDAQNPTLKGATGAPITGQELLVVLAVIDLVDDVFDLVEDLVRPVDNLIVLAWIL